MRNGYLIALAILLAAGIAGGTQEPGPFIHPNQPANSGTFSSIHGTSATITNNTTTGTLNSGNITSTGTGAFNAATVTNNTTTGSLNSGSAAISGGTSTGTLSSGNITGTGTTPDLIGFKASGTIDPRGYGAVLDEQICSDITATNAGAGGAIQITSAGCANFTGRTGELLALTNSSNARNVNTTIASVQSATVATLNTTASAPSGTVTAVFGADAGAATNTYIASQPMGSTFIIQWPPGHMLLTGSPIDFLGRNVILRGSGSQLGGGISTGTQSTTGSVVIPIFASLPSPASVVYIHDTWGAHLENWAIQGDSLYGNSLALIETQKHASGYVWTQTWPVFQNLDLGDIQGIPLNGATPSALYGIKIDGTGAQNDRGRINNVEVDDAVYGVSFCPDLSHPGACQAVQWHVKKLTCNRVAVCWDQSHGSTMETVEGMEDLSSGLDFNLGDSAVVYSSGYASEHDGGDVSFAPLWTASTIYPRNFTVEDATGYFHTQAHIGGCTSRSSTPTWNETTGGMTNEGTCVWFTDGNTSPPSLLAVGIGTGGNPAGVLHFDNAQYDVSGWLPPYGSPANALVSADAGSFVLDMKGSYFKTNSSNPPTGLNPVFDLTTSNNSQRVLKCRSCYGVGMQAGLGNAVGIYTASVGGDARQNTQIQIDRSPGYGYLSNPGDYGADFINVLINGAALDNLRFDFPGEINEPGGNLTVSQVAAPGSIFNVSCSSSGSNTYKYKATSLAGNGAGESTPSSEVSVGSCCTVGVSGCAIKGQLLPVLGAGGYRIYRTAAGGASNSETWVPMGILPNQVAVGSLGTNSWIDSTTDANLNAQVPPSTNTTGNASIAGVASVGILRLQQTAVPTPTSAVYSQQVQMQDKNGNWGWVPWAPGSPTATPTPAPTPTSTATAVPSPSPTPQ